MGPGPNNPAETQSSGLGAPTALTSGETAGTDVVPTGVDTTFTLAIGDSVDAFVNTVNDKDWYAVNLVAGTTYAFGMTANSGGLDCYVELYSAGGQLLAADDDSNVGNGSLLTFLSTQTGTYYVVAKDFQGSGESSTGGYHLSAATTTAPQILDSINWGTQVASSTVLVYFANAGETFNGETSLGWNTYEKQQTMLALQQYANVANLTFATTTNSAAATFKLVTTTSTDYLGEFSPPGTAAAGVGHFARNGGGWDEQGGGGLEQGGQGFEVLIHELGHGLGMAHPHDEGGASTVMQRVSADFGSYGLYGLNQGVFTTMSYNDGWSQGPSGASNSNNYGLQMTPMALDVALIQQKYGANMSYHTGDDVYTLTGSSTSGGYSCIWDAGGVDTIAYAGTTNCLIDLTAATVDYTPTGGGVVSYINGAFGGFTIAQGVVIERATGGSGDDTLIGNSANNLLIGNGGSDTINGKGGYDIAQYSTAYLGFGLIHAFDGSWIVNAGTDGTDTVSNVELLRFTDRDISLNALGHNTFDFGLDLKSDILFRNTSGELYVWKSDTGTGVSFTGQSLGFTPTDWKVQSVGDYNGDGKADVLWRNVSGEVYVSASTPGSGVALSGQSLGFVPNDWTIQSASGDFNGDGRTDVLWRNASGEVYVWKSQLTSNVSYVGQSLGVTPNDWSIQGVGDLNGDGKSDILWRNASGEVYAQVSDSTVNSVNLSGQSLGFVPNEWHIQFLADFNGDGKDDILWRNDSGEVYVWNSQAGSGVGYVGQGLGFTPNDWHIAGVGDFNGDGKADVLWRNDNGDVYAWKSQAGSAVAFNGQDLGVVGNEWAVVHVDGHI
jgi:hypothetical protein